MCAVYGLVGWAYIERVSWGCFWLYLHFHHKSSLYILLCSIMAFQLLYILYISSDVIHFPTLIPRKLN